MVVRTYFDKNNTIVSNLNVNTGLNPVAELFYGGNADEQKYSRFVFLKEKPAASTIVSRVRAF